MGLSYEHYCLLLPGLQSEQWWDLIAAAHDAVLRAGGMQHPASQQLHLAEHLSSDALLITSPSPALAQSLPHRRNNSLELQYATLISSRILTSGRKFHLLKSSKDWEEPWQNPSPSPLELSTGLRKVSPCPEKVLTRAFFLLKAPINTFTIKN